MARKTPEERKAYTLAFRVRGSLREALAKAAAISGKPMSEEAEARLQASFDIPAIVAETIRAIRRNDAACDAISIEMMNRQHIEMMVSEAQRLDLP